MHVEDGPLGPLGAVERVAPEAVAQPAAVWQPHPAPHSQQLLQRLALHAGQLGAHAAGGLHQCWVGGNRTPGRGLCVGSTTQAAYALLQGNNPAFHPRIQMAMGLSASCGGARAARMSDMPSRVAQLCPSCR